MGQAQSSEVDRVYDPKKAMENQIRREAAILVEDDTCSIDLSASTSETNKYELLDNTDQFIIKEALEYKYYDFEFMRALGCLFKIGLTLGPNMKASNYVKQFFTDLKQIGAPSVEGVALLAGQQGLKDMFIIKAPKDPRYDNLVHEYFIAQGGYIRSLDGETKLVIGTNWLRKVCLNYAQIFGAFRCSAPEVDPLSKNVRKWCAETERSGLVNYVIYEKVNGMDFATRCKDITLEDYIVYLIQIAWAIEIGQIYNGFCHYDLHSENIIVRTLGDYKMVPFVMSNSLTVYIRSNGIPTFIDYGRSHIQTPSPSEENLSGRRGDHFGYHSSFGADYGMYPDEARPFYDLYKIIGFTLSDMVRNKNQTANSAAKILDFFGIDSKFRGEWIKRGGESNNLYSLREELNVEYCAESIFAPGVCANEQDLTMNDFLAYIEVAFPQIWKENVFGYLPKGIPVLKCGTDCDNFEGSIADITMDTSNISPEHMKHLGGIASFIRYRNNIASRARLFQEKYPESSYGNILAKDVEDVNAWLYKIYPETSERLQQQLFEKGKKVIQAYDQIGYPIKYSEYVSSIPDENLDELFVIDGYLNRMGIFAKVYQDWREDYEAAEDMARGAKQTLPKSITDLFNLEITPLFQTYDNSRGEMRELIYSLEPIPSNYEKLKRDLVAKTL